ncbi:aminotransferase class V-fold PLP-dependent enzyme [Corynebacterium liangguodongii]|uniref:Aminotransferase n=1 Tax=Corynebacterium liangguodongii TaxID=2079535 RepID=A0A2S0WBM2_9CORY|nr:aminotransferase class V-fold PLP-dependent enzyme [Corynebacterium liangguodongii]AWB83165.1 aminotransferase [Corynebacterium liangguodongii]PWB98760.1 alanine--glyoxylate aminotransferase family protein [Corynebacterium liangguodongii]
MTQLPRPDIDPDGLLEYSVVFTDRSLNHMSRKFISAAQELLGILTETYGAETVALIPGGGTGAMEAVARQLATGKKVLIIRQGNFTYRWSQIIEKDQITDQVKVLNAVPTDDSERPAYAPPALDDVRAAIASFQPDLVVTAHTETASGTTLGPDYVTVLGAAAHDAGALFVLDCIAAGADFTNMREAGVDVLVSAPQKSWSGSPATGYVMLSAAGRAAVVASESTSFTLDLKRWLEIFEGYRDGVAAYHSTLPTDTIVHNLEVMKESLAIGLDTLAQRQVELGRAVREGAYARGYTSVAAEGFESNGVVVLYADTPELKSGAALKPFGVQIAAGVPLVIGEGEDFSTFRIGLFGLDKWADPQAAAQRILGALDRV